MPITFKTTKMKPIVYYYSRNGSNRFLAHKIAADLNCEIEELKPRINHLLLMLMGINLGNRKLHTKVEDYDMVILCGPIWVGRFIVPLKNFVKKQLKKINRLIFATCCRSSFEDKDKQFGHNLVFQKVRQLLGEKCYHCEAFPLGLVLTPEQQEDPEAHFKYHLNEENFKGEILDIYRKFLQTIQRDAQSLHPRDSL